MLSFQPILGFMYVMTRYVF